MPRPKTMSDLGERWLASFSECHLKFGELVWQSRCTRLGILTHNGPSVATAEAINRGTIDLSAAEVITVGSTPWRSRAGMTI